MHHTQLLRKSPEQAATDLANITSNTAEIHAVDVSVATSIIEDLTTAALTNEEVRFYFIATQMCIYNVPHTQLSHKIHNTILEWSCLLNI